MIGITVNFFEHNKNKINELGIVRKNLRIDTKRQELLILLHIANKIAHLFGRIAQNDLFVIISTLFGTNSLSLFSSGQFKAIISRFLLAQLLFNAQIDLTRRRLGLFTVRFYKPIQRFRCLIVLQVAVYAQTPQRTASFYIERDAVFMRSCQMTHSAFRKQLMRCYYYHVLFAC